MMPYPQIDAYMEMMSGLGAQVRLMVRREDGKVWAELTKSDDSFSYLHPVTGEFLMADGETAGDAIAALEAKLATGPWK